MSVFCHELTVVVVVVMFCLKEDFWKGLEEVRKRRKEVNHCKEQGGEERVAVAVLCFQVLISRVELR